MIHVVTLDLPASVWVTSNSRLHWRTKARKVAAVRTLARASARGAQQIQRANVVVEVGYPTNAIADPANTEPMVKAAMDGIVDAGLLPDDDSRHVLRTTYERGPKTSVRGIYRLTITLEEVPA